jgi:signal transduction histidine kinase
MRADPHYVEALARPRVAPAVTTPAAPVEPPALGAPGDRAFGAASEALARALTSLHASLADVAVQGRPLRERLLLELARAEAIRASWLAEALAVLQSEPMPALDQVNLSAVVARVADALGSEHRLAGASPAIARTDVPARVFGDERLLTVAVGGMLLATCAAVEGRAAISGVSMRVTAIRDGSTRGVEVVQSAMRLPAPVLARLFDASWTEHPAGQTGAMLLAAARRIAQLQGGSLEARAMENGGCRLVLTLPAAE